MNKRQNIIIILGFIGLLSLGLFLSILWPKSAFLKNENRMAAEFPQVNFESIKTGLFSQGFENYYTDQFPLRDWFMGFDRSMHRLLTGSAFSSGADQVQVFHKKTDLGQGQNLQDLSDAKAGQNPRPSEGNTANTPVSTDPNAKASNANTPQVTTAPTDDPRYAKPDANAALPVVDEDEVQNVNNVILVGDRAMEIFYYNEEINASYGERVSRLARLLSPSTKVYNIPVPTSVEFYASESYRGPDNSQKRAFETVRENLSSDVTYVDAYAEIRAAAADPNNYLYLRTDHHWTQLGAYYAYRAFCSAAGITPLALDEMDHGVIKEPSYGSMLGYTDRAQVLVDNPDTVEYWKPKYTVTGIAVDNETDDESAGYDVDLIAKDFEVDNKYLAFTMGDHSYLHYHSSIANGKSVLLLKESYGNAFVPFLTGHYEHVYVLDPRRITSISLSQFCQEHHIDDCIVMNYSFGIANGSWQDAFESMIY